MIMPQTEYDGPDHHLSSEAKTKLVPSDEKLKDRERKLIRELYSLKGATRQQLSRRLQWSTPTVYRIVDDLVQRGVVRVSGTGEDIGIGRPTEWLVVRMDYLYVFSVHIARDAYYTALIDLRGGVHRLRKHDFTGPTRPEQLVDSAHRDYLDALVLMSIPAHRVAGLALAVVGPLNYRSGRMMGPIHFGGGDWLDVPIVELMTQRFNMSVEYDCNASACLMGHYLPAYYERYANMAYITIGTGLGSGLVLGNRLHQRHHIILDGLAHMCVEINGRRCTTCGALGCVESYVSKPAIVQACQIGLRMGKQSQFLSLASEPSFEDICRAYRQGDSLASDVVEEASRVFSVCLANYLRIVDLEAVILGGSLIEGIPAVFDVILRKLNEHPGISVEVIRGEEETMNTLKGIAAQYILQQVFGKVGSR